MLNFVRKNIGKYVLLNDFDAQICGKTVVHIERLKLVPYRGGGSMRVIFLYVFILKTVARSFFKFLEYVAQNQPPQARKSEKRYKSNPEHAGKGQLSSRYYKINYPSLKIESS